MNSISTSIRVELLNVGDEADKMLHERLMCPQQSAVRYAYQALREGKLSSTELWHRITGLYPLLTGRSANDAITTAKAVIASQRELLPEHIAQLGRRIERIEPRLHRMENDGAEDERRGLQDRLERYVARKDELQAHQASGSVPAAVFGGRRLWRKVVRRIEGAQIAWREKRSGQFVSYGVANYEGNPHCRLIEAADNSLQLHVRVPNGWVKKGNAQITRALWLVFELSYSRSYDELLRQTARRAKRGEAKYTVRLLRLAPQKFRAYITVDEPIAHQIYTAKEVLPDWCATVIGIDLNLDHIAAAISDKQGQYRARKSFDCANLGELPRHKSRWLIGNIVKDVIQWAQSQGASVLILEDLKFRSKLTGSKRYNRRTVPFAHRQLSEALIRAALRQGLAVKLINPAYTSWIGQTKYSRQYGVSVHLAAAYVIARRGLGLDERLPKWLVQRFPVLIAMIEADLDRLKMIPEGKRGSSSAVTVRRTWKNRLKNWRAYTPEAGRPWLLWVTLHEVAKNISGAREVITLKEQPILTAP